MVYQDAQVIEEEDGPPTPAGLVARDEVATRSLADQAYEKIVDLLLGGSLVAGEVLQERRLAVILNISRTPVREALGRLEAEGLVSRHGRVVRVADIDPAAYIEVLDVRLLLEPEAAHLAAGRISRSTAEHIRAEIWRLMETPSPTPAEHWAVDDLVHGTIAEAAGNRHAAGLILDLRRRTHVFNTRRIPDRLRPGALEHLAIIDAVSAGDADTSRNLMRRHISHVKDAIMKQLAAKANSG